MECKYYIIKSAKEYSNGDIIKNVYQEIDIKLKSIDVQHGFTCHSPM